MCSKQKLPRIRRARQNTSRDKSYNMCIGKYVCASIGIFKYAHSSNLFGNDGVSKIVDCVALVYTHIHICIGACTYLYTYI